VEAEVGHRADEGAQLVELPLVQGAGEVLRPVGVAHARPGDKVGARCDRRRRVDLQEGEVAHDLEQVGRPLRVEQLRAHGDPPRLLLGSIKAPYSVVCYGYGARNH
jgi:hypothetical protein